MLNIMLIDDESIVLNGIETMLKAQNEVKLRIVSFLDSVQALEALPTLQIDVVITDINMPELDGLSFIGQSQKAGYKGRYMIISGYEEVDYLKRALSYQVVDYLVKPIDKTRLYALIKQMEADKQQAMQSLLFSLTLFLTGNQTPDNTLKTMSASEIRLLLPEPFVMLIAAQDCDADAFAALTKKIQAVSPYAYAASHGRYKLLLCNAPSETGRDSHLQLLDTCRDQIPGGLGISPVQPTARFIADIQNENGSALLYQAVAHIAYQHIELDAELAKACDPALLTYQFANELLSPQNQEELDQTCGKLMAESPNNTVALTQAFLEIASMVSVQYHLVLSPDTFRRLYQQKCAEVTNAKSLRITMENLLKSFLECADIQHTGIPSYSDKVEQALLYIKRHYHEDISLYSVAAHIGINASYLSTLFSKETGETFLNYLHRLRMDAACELLEKYPSVSAGAVSKRVGYQTPNSFFRIFKNQFGMSPSQWRSARKHDAQQAGGD